MKNRDANDTKLGRRINILEGMTAIQEGLDKLEKYADKKIMKINKCKCKILHLRQNNAMHQYRLDTDCLESSFAEEGLG